MYRLEMTNLEKLVAARLPKYLVVKGVININGKDCIGRVIPYAMRIDKNGYPQFLLCIGDTWIWKSAKHFAVEW